MSLEEEEMFIKNDLVEDQLLKKTANDGET